MECSLTSNRWVFSAELKHSKIGNHSIYDPKKSASAKLLSGASWDISYGDGSSAKGNVYTDTVSVGGSVATGQAVELASKVSKQFVDDYASDGLLGLAFDSINTGKFEILPSANCLVYRNTRRTNTLIVSPTTQKPFFSNVKANLAAPLVTADLNQDATGSYDVGFIDSTKYTGSITYLPANNSQGFWGVTSTSYGVGDSSNMTTKSIEAIVDTGTSLLLVPQDVLDAYYGQVKGAKNSKSDQGYIFPCQATLPDFIIGLGEYDAVIPGAAVNNTAVSDTRKSCIASHSSYLPETCTNHQPTDCYGGIQYSDPSNGPAGIYGDVFLKSSFVVFKYPDGGSPQIGFAAKGSDGSATPAPSSSSSSSGGGNSDGDDEEEVED